MQIAVVVATALAALANWWSRLRDDDRLELWTKPLTTVLVIKLALASGAHRGDVIVAVVALALCLAGDVFLLPAVDRFVPGLAAFLLGHVVFIVLFVRYGLDSLALGAFLAGVPALLAIGTVLIDGGRTVKGFLVEAEAIVGARDISSFGGWRAYVESLQPAGSLESV